MSAPRRLAPRGRARLIMSLLVCVAAGCTAPAGASPAPSSSAQSSPSASAPAPTPWQAEIADLAPDGTRSLESALRLFAMAFGPLPGVTGVATAEAGSVGSASPAVRAVTALRDQLTAEQRDAIDGYLAAPQDSTTIDVPAGDPSGGYDRRLVAMAGVVVAQDGYDPFEREMQRIGTQARTASARYFGEMSAAPDGTSRLSIRTMYAPSEPFTSFFNPTFGPDGGFERCDVFVNTAHESIGVVGFGRPLTLDVIHCYQSWRAGSEDGFDGNVPAWAWEGPAEYILLESWPRQDVDYQHWKTYIVRPDIPLFERSYDAIGVYAQAREAGIDLSEAFVAVLTDVPNPERFALAGLASSEFLDKWASELLRHGRGDWGDDWLFLGPALNDPALGAPEQPIRFAPGSVDTFAQEPYTNRLFVLAGRVDILRVTATGQVRIADGDVDELIVGGADYCITDKGCGPCPDGSDPAISPTPLSGVSVLAVSGGNEGAHGMVSGHHLEEFCEEEEDEFCAAYRDLLHWWFLEAQDIGSQAWAAEIVRRFEEMRPLAPPAQQGAVDVHIGLYTAYATYTGPKAVEAAVPWAQQMPDAVKNLDSHCDITPADRGG